MWICLNGKKTKHSNKEFISVNDALIFAFVIFSSMSQKVFVGVIQIFQKGTVH